MAYRPCSSCCTSKHSSDFSRNQWSKGVGMSRCMTCVGNWPAPNSGRSAARGPLSARRNNSTEATFTHHALDNPFAEGAFRWVAQGKYTSGQRAGQKSVCKWFKTGGVMSDRFFEKDILALDRTLSIVDQFNNEDFGFLPIKVNMAEVWTFDDDSTISGEKVLQEPFIRGFMKWNSNSGWADDDDDSWPAVMQALSHYSYHATGGQLVLCDLQGGIYADAAVITDPVILSRTRSYGVTDLGPAGIENFFAHHECNDYCQDHWSRPVRPRVRYNAMMGTAMVG